MTIAELRVFVAEELSNSAEEHLRQKPSQTSELTKNCKNTVKCSCMFIQEESPHGFCVLKASTNNSTQCRSGSIQLYCVSEVELFGGR